MLMAMDLIQNPTAAPMRWSVCASFARSVLPLERLDSLPRTKTAISSAKFHVCILHIYIDHEMPGEARYLR